MKSKFEIEYAYLMPDVFVGVNSLADLQAKIQLMYGHEKYAEFAGFLFEFVVAKYFKKFGEHHTVNVCEYVQTYAGHVGEYADHGLDGYGVDILGKRRIVCQVKYRSNETDRIGQEFNNPDKQKSLNTFINEICRNLAITPNLIVLLCTTSDECVKLDDKKSVERVPFCKRIKDELKLRGVSADNMILRIYDIKFWNLVLKNPRFWNFVRNEFSI